MKNIKSFESYLTDYNRRLRNDDVEMSLSDDLNTNFRDWEDGLHDNQEDAEELADILISRHYYDDPDEVRQKAFDWVGYESEEFPEDFE